MSFRTAAGLPKESRLFGALLKPKDQEGTTNSISRSLDAVRRHLGMEVAYVSEFVDGRAVFRHVDAPGLDHLIKVGDSQDLKDVYCEHILAGRLPELMPDTADFELAVSLPITRAVPIGAHVSVPVRLKDGRPYGMFCCLSPTPNLSLNQRDLDMMRVFADLAGQQISSSIEAEQGVQAARDQIDRVIVGTDYRFHYQPIMQFDPGTIIGYEALCRFQAQPYRSPDLWFNEAFKVGLGTTLELAVIDMAIEALDTVPDDQFVSINASPDTIMGGSLIERLAGWPLGRIVIEVTEHAAVEDYQALRAALDPLRRAGARLAIDDAGAGFASLQHIVHLAPDFIKLDKTLTKGIDADAVRRALAAALAHFANETNSRIIAEGIETDAEYATLRSLGIVAGQGYLFGRPSPLPAAPLWKAVSRPALAPPSSVRLPLLA